MMIRTHPFGVPYRPVYGYVMLLAVLLVLSWDSALDNAAMVKGAIPAEAIRLRILANSDSAPDQAVKRHVRSAVAGELERLAAGAESAAEAREAISASLPELEALVKRELESRGFGYGASVRLGPAPFPAKIHGGRVYPAGEYETLLITLGEGRGENWWCVLFPPLCFADAVGTGRPEQSDAAERGRNAPDAVRGERNAQQAAAGEPEAGGKANGDRNAHDALARKDAADGGRHAGDGSGGRQDAANAADGVRDVEIRFALWDLLQRILEFFKRLFG